MPAAKNVIAKKFDALPAALKERAYAWRQKAIEQGGTRRRFTYQKDQSKKKIDPALVLLVAETHKAGVTFRAAEQFFLFKPRSGMAALHVCEFAAAQRRSEAARVAAIASNKAQAAKRAKATTTEVAQPVIAQVTPVLETVSAVVSAVTEPYAETDLIPVKWQV